MKKQATLNVCGTLMPEVFNIDNHAWDLFRIISFRYTLIFLLHDLDHQNQFAGRGVFLLLSLTSQVQKLHITWKFLFRSGTFI